jgi:MFS family permease
LALAVLVVGMFMSVLDVTIVNVAVPAIQTDFGGSLRDVLWIATAYTLTLGVVVPVSGWLGDRFGLRRVYLLALLGFAAGSPLCAIAWSLDALIVFRILQVSGGILPVVIVLRLLRC